jgi:flagellin-like protein
MLKLQRSRKAVSPVLATLLMIAVAVSMSVILFMWSQGFLSSVSEAAHEQQRAQNIVVQSQIAIENVRFYESGGTKYVEIMIRNVGSTEVTLSNVYIDNETQATITWDPDTKKASPQGTVKATVTYTWTAGETYIIKVTTTVGTFAETAVTAPTS